MDEALLTQARLVVLAPRWRWMVGMCVRPVRVDGTVEDTTGVIVGWIGEEMPVAWWPDLAQLRSHHPTTHLVPELASSATLGCLLTLARQGWGPSFHTHLDDWPGDEPAWLAHDGHRTPEFRGLTEAAALVAAIIGAPAN